MENLMKDFTEVLLQQIRTQQSLILSLTERLEAQEERHLRERQDLMNRLLSQENPQAFALKSRAEAIAKAAGTPRQPSKPVEGAPSPVKHFPRDLSGAVAAMGIPETPPIRVIPEDKADAS